MKSRPISFALPIFLALISCLLQAHIVSARRVFGRQTTTRIKSLSDYGKRSGSFGQSNNLGLAREPNLSLLVQTCRGGALDDVEEDEYDEEYDNDEEDEEETGVQSREESPTAISSMLNTLTSVSRAIVRALKAATQGVEAEEAEEELSLVGKVVQTMKKMISAALNPDYDDNPNYEKKKQKSSTAAKQASKVASKVESTADIGSYLSSAYGAADGRKGETPILGGSLTDALKIARSSGRLLVVLIPSAPPNKTKKKSDSQAITSFLSAEVEKVAKKKARKNGETASFLLWSAKAGSSEATAAMKRLKAKATSSRGDKRPILLVAYPAQAIGPNGVPKVGAKVLAQHHCSPPPSAEAMAQWMNELRKRHSKQYATMQRDIRESQLFKERKEGYKESVQSDVERKIREKKEEEERLVKEKAEKERLEALEKRRAEFLESLPEEPGSKVRNAITLSVRHPDGRSEKRRFAPDTQLTILFNWVDASFQMERELVVLTTMNGKQTFSWEDAREEKTLKEAGLGRMVGFRVSEKKVEEVKEEEADGKEEEAKQEEA